MRCAPTTGQPDFRLIESSANVASGFRRSKAMLIDGQLANCHGQIFFASQNGKLQLLDYGHHIDTRKLSERPKFTVLS